MQPRVTLSLLVLGLAAGACQDRAAKSPAPAEDPDWIRLEIPKGREANAVYGNLDTMLVVTTYKDAYYTTDKGLLGIKHLISLPKSKPWWRAMTR